MTDLVPYLPAAAGTPETEHVNVNVAMAGLSEHTQRAYRRWIRRYLGDINDLPARQIPLEMLSIQMVLESLGTANLKAWLGKLKASRLGKQSIMQAKAAVVWLAQFMADMEKVDYSAASGLSRVKAPRAETGQRTGTWLAPEDIRRLLVAVRRVETRHPGTAARNVAIITLMVTCGLRRDEVAAALWSDLTRQGRNNVLMVHGKGEKLRTVKLPDMVLSALEVWRNYHVLPEGERPIFTQIRQNGRVTTQGITDRAVWNVVNQAAKAAGIPRLSPHDLRRSFARGAYEAGVSFELIRQALGHSSIATTERYVNSVLELDRAATDIWAGLLDDE
ncbi:MAG: tyrosine-type recombinase/integrase [Anaerolineae bacterium]